jgi:hypothetical protein
MRSCRSVLVHNMLPSVHAHASGAATACLCSEVSCLSFAYSFSSSRLSSSCVSWLSFAPSSPSSSSSVCVMYSCPCSCATLMPPPRSTKPRGRLPMLMLMRHSPCSCLTCYVPCSCSCGSFWFLQKTVILQACWCSDAKCPAAQVPGTDTNWKSQQLMPSHTAAPAPALAVCNRRLLRSACNPRLFKIHV